MTSEFLHCFFKDYHTFSNSCQVQQPNPINPVNNDESEGWLNPQFEDNVQ